MDIKYENGNFEILGENLRTFNLGEMRDGFYDFMKSQNARVEEFHSGVFKKTPNLFSSGYYLFLKCSDKYFLRGNLFTFKGETDLLEECYNDPFYQAQEDRGIFILKKDGREIPYNQGRYGREPELSDSGEFSISIRGYKNLKKSQTPDLRNLLGESFAKSFQKQLK